MATKLPAKLNKEPLIDALFELRFNANSNFSELVPGLLFAKLPGELELQRLPHAELPKAIRDQDPNLKYASLVKISWGNYIIGLGDRSFTVSCALPYPGWNDFASAIATVMEAIKSTKMVQSVVRYSLKYTDLIPAETIPEQLSKTTISVKIAGVEGELSGHTTLRTEVFEDGYIHILNIVTSANAKMASGEKRTGLVIDVDSIKILEEINFDEWLSDYQDELNKIHAANKDMFFKCITEDTLESLEPTYD